MTPFWLYVQCHVGSQTREAGPRNDSSASGVKWLQMQIQLQLPRIAIRGVTVVGTQIGI